MNLHLRAPVSASVLLQFQCVSIFQMNEPKSRRIDPNQAEGRKRQVRKKKKKIFKERLNSQPLIQIQTTKTPNKETSKSPLVSSLHALSSAGHRRNLHTILFTFLHTHTQNHTHYSNATLTASDLPLQEGEGPCVTGNYMSYCVVMMFHLVETKQKLMSLLIKPEETLMHRVRRWLA